MAIQLTLIASVLSVSAPALAQTCTASASANAGDNVTVLAILHTDDPNENGEGEPLSVTISNGGGTFLFGDYETTHSFNFQAAATAPVTVGGTIIGFDGDESCEVSVSVNAHHRFTPTQKGVLAGITGGFGIASGSAWVVAEVCLAGGPIPAGICSLPAGVVAASSALVSAGAGFLLLIDPIDMNFMVIPIPEPATFPAVTAGGGLTQADADALNALLSNESAMIGLLRASTTAANRASGAQSVSDTYWEQKQVDAINGFMSQLGALLTKEANLREALVGLFATENFPTVAITADQVYEFEFGLAFYGWSQNALGYLRQLGADDAFIAYARPLIFTQDINVVAGVFPSSLANPTLISMLRQGGRDLALTPFVGVPQDANCHGVSVSGLTAQFGSMSKAAQALSFESVQSLQSAITAFCGK